MTVFWKIVRTSIKVQLTYRMALWAGLTTNLFFGLLHANLLIALYNGQPSVNGLSMNHAITYVAFSQSLIAFLTIFGSWDLMNSVYSGAIGADLLRPLHLFTFWMAQDIGRSLVNLVGRGLLFMLLYALVFPITLPSNPITWLYLFVSLTVAWLVSFAWRFLVNISAFWSPDARGIGRIGFALVQFLSGFIMPLRLLPDWFNQLCQATPFPAMVNTPAEVFLGILNEQELIRALLLQFGWFILLSIASMTALRAGIRRLVIQGG